MQSMPPVSEPRPVEHQPAVQMEKKPPEAPVVVVSTPPPIRQNKPQVQRPVAATKSADDLKAILRTMTQKTTVEKEQKQTENKESLKGTLAEVLARTQSSKPPVMPAEPPQEKLLPSPPLVAAEKKPFEVPEDTLEKVLKGEA